MTQREIESQNSRGRIVAAFIVVGLCAGLAVTARVSASRRADAVSAKAASAARQPGHEATALPTANPDVPSDEVQFEGRRDPFKLPPPPSSEPSPMKEMRPVNLPPGPRGLIVRDLKLEGVVAENSGRNMIAVVTNNSDRAYFLVDNEQLYDGQVTRITPDAVYFTEKVVGAKGEESVRQVVKSLTGKAGEAQ